MEINGETLYSVIAGLVGGVFGFLAKTVWIRLKSELTEKQLSRLMDWVIIAVRAARKAMPDKPGSEKLLYAETVLNAAGFDHNDIQVRAVLEATLDELDEEYAIKTLEAIPGKL